MIDLSDKKGISVRVTPQLRSDIELISSYFGIDKLSHIIQGSVRAQADAIRARQAGDTEALAPALEATDE